MSFEFYLRNQDTLEITKHGFVRDKDGRGIVIKLAMDHYGVSMKNGALVAEKFGLTVPTLTKFEYAGPLNMFIVSFLADDNAHVANNVELVQEAVGNPQVAHEEIHIEEVVQEVIDISSDEEVHMTSDHEEQDEVVQEEVNPHCFEQFVSTAMTGSVYGKPMVSYTKKNLLLINKIYFENEVSL